MTNEQIKQNAEAYADKNCVFDYNSTENDAVINAFIAGAHSRDEEIEKLMKRIEELEDEVAQLVNGEDY